GPCRNLFRDAGGRRPRRTGGIQNDPAAGVGSLGRGLERVAAGMGWKTRGGFRETRAAAAPAPLPAVLVFGPRKPTQHGGALMPVVGIDLGTTNSLIGMFRNGRPHLFKDAQGRSLVPSVVYYPRDAKPVVGY